MDTSGDMQFPAMRRLSIATAHAFLLVYATTSAPSFSCVKQCFEEIREQRADFQVNVVNQHNTTLNIIILYMGVLFIYSALANKKLIVFLATK